MTNIELIREVKRNATNHWDSLLPLCGVNVPERGKHGACPVCGGTDRFHFIDDHHNGNWFCRQCDEPNHGDGLDLIAKVKGISIYEAAKEVSQALSLPLPEPARKEAPKSESQPITEKVQKLVAQTTVGKSAYLTQKGHECPVKLLADGSMLLIIQRGNEVTGAQVIKPNGEKRLISGTKKKGSFMPLSELPETTETVLIAEGYATALTVSQLHSGLVLAAIDEGNLLSVTEWARKHYPKAKIIIAADNDIKIGQPNVGKISAEKAAKTVNGWVTLPPTEDKADWDDYRQQFGIEKAKQAFSEGMYQMESTAKQHNNIEQIHSSRKTKLPLSVGSQGFDLQSDYVIKGVIPANSLCSIYGASGSYKSFLAGSWGCHISTGKAWAGKTVAHGSVMYVVGEGGIGVPRRVKAWEITNGQTVDNMYLVNTPVFPASPSEVSEMVIAAKQVEAETGKPVRLIIIDTLARCFGGADENDSKDMGAFIRGCDELKAKTGATVLVVHHSGKDESKGARGSSAFRAALDAEYKISREGKGGALIIACTKMKDAEELETKAYDLRVVELFTDADGEHITSLSLVDKPRDPQKSDEIEFIANKTYNHAVLWQSIRSRTAMNEACTVALVRDDLKAMGVNVKHFSRWLTKLEKDGLIRKEGQKLFIINQSKDIE